MPAMDVNPTADVAATQASPAPKRRRIWVVALVVALVVVTCLAGWYLYEQHQKQLWEQAHTPATVAVRVVADGLDASGSPVGVHVVGCDLDGNAVDQTVALPATNGQLELLRGEYDVTLVGSPVTSAGGTFAVPDAIVHVSISADDSTTAVTTPDGSHADDASFSLEPMAAEDVTDEQIAAISDWMGKLGVDNPSAWTQLVTDARTARQEEIAAEQAKREAEQKAAAEKAAQEEAERQKAAAEQAKKDAIAKNPTSVTVGDTITLTGTVGSSQEDGFGGDGGFIRYYYVTLAAPLSVSGDDYATRPITKFQIGSLEHNGVSGDSYGTNYDKYVGCTVTVSGQVLPSTGNWHTMGPHFNNAPIAKVW